MKSAQKNAAEGKISNNNAQHSVDNIRFREYNSFSWVIVIEVN